MADYEELIGVKFSVGDSLDQMVEQYKAALKEMNAQGLSLGVDGGALSGIVQQLQQVKGQLDGFATQWKEVFGTGADAAAESTASIKDSVASAETAFVASQQAQTEAAKNGARQRIEIAQGEADAIRRTQEELKAKSQITPEVSRYGSEFLKAELQKIEAAKLERQALLKSAPSGDEFEGAGLFGANVVQKELDRLEKVNAARSAAQKKAEEAAAEEQRRGGVGGFFRGIGTGLAPGGDSSAASIGEFIGQATRFVAAYAAIRVAAEGVRDAVAAPFQIIKDGIQYLEQFQERSSEIKATLLDHGFFSKDPAENLLAAGKAADELAQKVENLADKLNVKPETIQAAFNTFSDYGGNSLTGSLDDSVQLAGFATAALQSQNPRIQQRTVAQQLQKLTSGDLKDTDKLPAALGISAEKLNEMVEHARTAHDLLQQIQQNAPGLADRLGSANDRLAPLEDTLTRVKERLEGILSTNAVQVLTDSAKELVGWLDRNKDSLEAIAGALGKIAGTSLAALLDDFKQMMPIVSVLAKLLAKGAATTAEGTALGANAITRALSGEGEYSQAVDFLSDASSAEDRLNKLGNALDGHPNGDDPVLGGKIPLALQAPKAPEIGYTNTTQPPPKKVTGNPSRDAIGAIRNSYESQVDAIKKGSQAVRDSIEEDARAFRISLATAADLKRTSFENETKALVDAGAKAQAALAKVPGGKNPAAIKNAKDALIRTITGNDTSAGNAAAKGEQRDEDAITKQGLEVDSINRAGVQSRELEEASNAFNQREQFHQKQVVSDAQFLQDEQNYWDTYYRIQIDGAQKAFNAIPADDFVKRAEAQQKILNLQDQQGLKNKSIDQQRFELPFQEDARAFAEQVERAQAAFQQQQIKTDVDRHAGLTETARHDNDALAKANQDVLFAQEQQASQALQQARAEAERANPGFTAAQISALPGVQEKQIKLQSIEAQLIKAQKMDIDHQGLTNEQAADALFGTDSGHGHFGSDEGDVFHNFAQGAASLGHLAKNISGGVGAIESGYQQSGAGGAVGAGLQTVGQFVPGPIGQAIAGAGAVVSLISSMFTQAAQEIGKEVAHAVDKVMEKYSTGQSTLNQTLASVQQQYNTLVAKETGRKGGQQVLDTEGVQLQQQIDQLKQQRQQVELNFADSTIVAGGTNSVAQQWLQTWISVNKEVQQYKNAVGDAAAEQLANQYLNEQLDQERKSLQDQYIQGQASAVNDALQLNQMLQQRNNYEDQYRQQVFSLQSQDSLARRGNPAEQTARQISLAKAQYNQETQQLNFQINTYQQKVDYEKQIYKLASNTADLQKQALSDQAYQLQEQVAQAQTLVALLASITGLKAVNGQIPGLSNLGINIPTNFGVNDGSLNGIPGYGAPGTIDNSATTITINIPVGAIQSTNPTQAANQIADALEYRLRTRGVAAY